jgi:hypothetical protein
MTHEYPPGLRGAVAPDLVLVGAWVAFLFLPDVPLPVRTLMLVAVPIVLAWGAATLHFPARIAIDDRGITFARYGRVHRFAWNDVARVKVRRFLVKDRILVRIEPSGVWRGRYWIFDSISGFEDLVRALERRGSELPNSLR